MQTLRLLFNGVARESMMRLPTTLPFPKTAQYIQNVVTRPFSILMTKPQTEMPVQNLPFCNASLLKPQLPLVQQVCGMKVRGKLKLRCKHCYYVMRQERMYVMCKAYGRHKQAAMQKKPKNTWILAHATQNKIRPW